MRGRKTGWRMGILYLLCKERERTTAATPSHPIPPLPIPTSPSRYNNNTNENLKRLAFHQSPKHVHNHGNQFHDAFNRYCSSLLSGLPASSVQSLHRMQNCAACLILKTHTRKTDHIIPLFQFLHWLPIQQRIQYKINTLCYKCITGTAPSYLLDCLQLDTPSRTLLSLQIPRARLSTVGSRAFCFRSMNMNDLPLPLRQKPSLDSFKI